MKWRHFFAILAILVLTTVGVAQDGVTYETYTAEDGRISFDVPEGWLVAPFGPSFNISTQGYVEVTEIQPGQQQIDVVLLNAEDLAAGGVARDLAPVAYTEAVLDMMSSEDDTAFTVTDTRTMTLDNGVEAGVLDISVEDANALVTVYQQDDATIFVSSTAHKSEFETFETIALHVINSIEPGENAGEASDSPQYPVVPIVAADDAIQMPPVPEEGVPAGMYTFAFTDKRPEMPYSPGIARFNEGVTTEQFNEALATDDGMGAVFLVTLLGGTVVMPDQTIGMTVELIPGDYILLELTQDGPVDDMIPFTVVDSEEMQNLEKPDADVTLTLVDFAFGIPPTIASGEQVWHIENAGEQWHEAAIFNVPEGTTVDDIVTRIESGEEDASEDLGQAFIWLPMGVGQEAWTTISLEPGTYAILCFLPDLTGDFSPHIAHGMVQVFNVE